MLVTPGAETPVLVEGSPCCQCLCWETLLLFVLSACFLTSLLIEMSSRKLLHSNGIIYKNICKDSL